MDDILKFIDEEYVHILEKFGLSEKEATFPMLAKIMEEIGELSQEVLMHSKLQRNDKLATHDKKNIEKEFADSILTVLFLAKNMGVDIRAALNDKISVIKVRRNE